MAGAKKYRVSRILELRECGIAITRRPCESPSAGQDMIGVDVAIIPLRPGERFGVEVSVGGSDWVVLTQLRVPEGPAAAVSLHGD